MENINNNPDIPKQRHGCVTAWLILMIIGNSLIALLYIFGGELVAQEFSGELSSSSLILLALLGIANVIFAILLLKWNKFGFWGYLLTSVAVLVVNIGIGISIGQSILGLLGVVILFGILQIKEGNISAWDNLE